MGGSVTDILPLVHLDCNKPHSLVVYHAINSTICLLLPCPPSEQFFRRYSDYMGPLLSNLSADLTHTWASSTTAASAPPNSDHVKFIYYNGANFAVKSTVEAGNENLVNLAAELAADLPQSGGEVTGKLGNDQWIVVRVAGVRTIIIMLTLKNLNLLEVSEEVLKLDKSSFSKICLL